MRPKLFVAAWNPGGSAEPDGIFSGLMKDGTFNLAMFETYTRYPPSMISPGGEQQNGPISQWFPRFDYAREEGWLNRSIPCLGMIFGKSKLNPSGWTQQELRATMQEIRDKYSEIPGVGFWGANPGNQSNSSHVCDTACIMHHDTATLELIEFANNVSVELWPDWINDEETAKVIARGTAPEFARDAMLKTDEGSAATSSGLIRAMRRSLFTLLLPLALAGTADAFKTRRVPHPNWTPQAVPPAAPSAAQLAWMDLEVGVNICYGIGTPSHGPV
jgi:hypothetical protein